MLTTATISLVFILICCLFFYFKQDMLKKLFANQLSYPTSELQDQLELTADIVIKNLESHITHLEDLLDQADERIELLDRKIQQTQQVLPEKLKVVDLAPTTVLTGTSQDKQRNPGTSAMLPYGVTQYQQQAISRFIENDRDQAIERMSNVPETTGQPISQQRHVIIAMFKQGYKATEIAKATGLGQGEILLFCQLYNHD
jgi:hypothetical protein